MKVVGFSVGVAVTVCIGEEDENGWSGREVKGESVLIMCSGD